MPTTPRLPTLLRRIKRCDVCAAALDHEPRPVVQAGAEARILVIGQAPGRRVHESGIPWNDPSGDRLRSWLGVDRELFYDPKAFALVPMGFCFPGTGRSGDLPPRPECAPLWHEPVLERLPSVELTLFLSRYAIDYYLAPERKEKLGDVVRNRRRYGPKRFPLPHPSPRNIRWFKNHPWFESEVVPELRKRARAALRS